MRKLNKNSIKRSRRLSTVGASRAGRRRVTRRLLGVTLVSERHMGVARVSWHHAAIWASHGRRRVSRGYLGVALVSGCVWSLEGVARVSHCTAIWASQGVTWGIRGYHASVWALRWRLGITWALDSIELTSGRHTGVGGRPAGIWALYGRRRASHWYPGVIWASESVAQASGRHVGVAQASHSIAYLS